MRTRKSGKTHSTSSILRSLEPEPFIVTVIGIVIIVGERTSNCRDANVEDQIDLHEILETR